MIFGRIGLNGKLHEGLPIPSSEALKIYRLENLERNWDPNTVKTILLMNCKSRENTLHLNL